MSLRSERLGDKLEAGINAVESALESLLEATAERARRTNRKSSLWMSRQERAAAGGGRELRHAMERRTRMMSDNAADTALAAKRFVKTRTWTAIGLTAAAAALVGVVLARR